MTNNWDAHSVRSLSARCLAQDSSDNNFLPAPSVIINGNSWTFLRILAMTLKGQVKTVKAINLFNHIRSNVIKEKSTPNSIKALREYIPPPRHDNPSFSPLTLYNITAVLFNLSWERAFSCPLNLAFRNISVLKESYIKKKCYMPLNVKIFFLVM